MSDNVAILDRLPHKPPFRFVTALTMLEPGVTGMGEWSLRGDEDFFKGHFPGEPIVPGVLLAESLAQLAGITLSTGELTTIAAVRLAHVDIKFSAAVTPPAVVSLHARLIRTMSTLSLFEVRATCRGDTAAIGTLTLSVGAKNDEGRVAL